MKRLAIFYHHPQCSIQSAHGIIKALSDDFIIDCINQTQLDNLSKYDLFAIPGGIGDSDSYYNILYNYKDQINHFAMTKKVLAICMGAYWCGPLYLNLIESNPVQYIKANDSDIKRSFGTTANVNWRGKDLVMYFYDGCMFELSNDVEVIARYSNHAPAAIKERNVLAIGPHPESDLYWYKGSKRKYWHHYSHHDLLRNEVLAMF